jgi:hypothetical protein
MARVPAEVNRLSNQVLVHTYERRMGPGARIERRLACRRVRVWPPARRAGLPAAVRAPCAGSSWRTGSLAGGLPIDVARR